MKLPKYTKNFYFIFTALFLVWMLFIDANDLITQYKLNQQRKNLEDEKIYYQEKIVEVQNEREELLGNDASLEKFAREKYLMKKPSEDLFVIVRDTNE